MGIRCPACQTENSNQTRVCTACGVKLPRRRRGAEEEQGPPPSTSALLAFRCAVCGLIPLVGLVMGPVALLLGFLAYRRGQEDVVTSGNAHAIAGMVFGGVIALTNWVGVLLMLYGLGVLSE